ncbi:MAG TPA: methionine--tRNA ligase [Thermodesulfobacteriota bacterium]|nr:methionine--tRNA ligase [Thermodesulfobacteriota bacterium]
MPRLLGRGTAKHENRLRRLQAYFRTKEGTHVVEKRFYITTPIYYVNAEPHIGHAYSTVVADTLNLFHKCLGYDSRFQTGTDEHGEKVVQAAEKEGLDPKAYADRISGLFRQTWPDLEIYPDHFIRTTDEDHIRVVTYILNKVHESGDIYFSEYEGQYCLGCERFYTERELVDGLCPDHKAEPTVVKEANYFFRMSAYQNWLIEHIHKNPDFIRPERYRNEVLSFLSEPLEDLCISRPRSRVTWGIPLPFDDQYVTYVWFDALINYLTGLGYPEGELYPRYWPSAQHVIAKDILKPHGIFWPIMLKAAGIEPYQHLNVHGYWNMDQAKISKSLGNVIRPKDLVARFGADGVRYFFLREMVFGLDAHFSEEAMIQRINADLANNLGNCFSRSLTMIEKYAKGKIPGAENFGSIEAALKEKTLQVREMVGQEVPKLAFHKALMTIWELVDDLNKYIDTQAPWALAKDPEKAPRLMTVLYTLAEVLRHIALLLYPFMPKTSKVMIEQLGLNILESAPQWEKENIWGKTVPGTSVRKGPALFPRIETGKPKAAASPDPAPAAPASPQISRISFEDFQKVDLRVARIIKAERVPKSKKLIKLEVDLGETRTVVAGIGQDYLPEELVGKEIIVVANLEPTKLMGVESQGMLLAARDDKGLKLLAPEGEIQPGTKVK